ncbi:unnamed protein product [Toxocara canis]|uniref:HABP4_PAI-RBP1 domain-containing protein n=1 Tax=Toxocara canis TaxID=6265 RepID=A0A183UWD5_TOXCA|nr:unnamed protein product [Toxocara canis]
MSMFEYGVNVANKFGSLSDDEVEDPEEILRKAEAASRKDEKTASQKKADKNAAARKKRETAAVAAQNAAAREADAKKAAAAAAQLRKPADPANKENRPDGERGRGRGRGRGGIGRGGRGGGGGPPGDGANRFPLDQGGDNFGDRFGETRGRGGRGRGGRGGRPPFRGGRGGGMTYPMEGDHEQNADDTNAPFVNGDQNMEFFGGGVGGGFRGGYRGGRGGYRGADGERPFFRGGRGGRGRQFERISGSDKTGVKPNDKREGYGKGNWGTDQDELTGETEQLNTAQQEGDKVEEPVAPREKTEEELRLDREAEALAKQLTLDEFKAQMAAKRSEPQFNIRKAGEGANEKQFGKLVPLTRDTIQEPQDEEIVIVRREPRAKRLDIEINFTDEQRGGRGRGGFRGGRGTRGGRGEGRGPRQNMTFEVSAEAFPALGAQ